MWETFLKLQLFFQRYWNLPIQFSESEQIFHVNPKRFNLSNRISDLASLAFWLASFLSLKSILSKHNEDHRNLEEVIRSCSLHLFYISVYAYLLGAIWTLKFKLDATVWMMSLAYRNGMERKRRLNRLGDNRYHRYDSFFEMGLYGVLSCATWTTLATCLVPLISKRNPVNFLLTTLLPPQITVYLGRRALALISTMSLLIFGALATISMAQFGMYQNAAVYEAVFVFKPEELLHRKRSKKLQYFGGFLFFSGMNSFGHLGVLLGLSSLFGMNVVSTLVCIRFFGRLHPIFLIGFGWMDVIVAFLTLYIHRILMMGQEDSYGFLREWERSLYLGGSGGAFGRKMAKREFRACLPIRIECGPFIYLKKRTLLSTFSETVNLTITALMI